MATSTPVDVHHRHREGERGDLVGALVDRRTEDPDADEGHDEHRQQAERELSRAEVGTDELQHPRGDPEETARPWRPAGPRAAGHDHGTTGGRRRPRPRRAGARAPSSRSRPPSVGPPRPGASVTLERKVARPTTVIATARSSCARGSFRSIAARSGMASTTPISSERLHERDRAPAERRGVQQHADEREPGPQPTTRGSGPGAAGPGRPWTHHEEHRRRLGAAGRSTTAKPHAALRAIMAATVACWSMGAPVLSGFGTRTLWIRTATRHLGRIPGIGTKSWEG